MWADLPRPAHGADRTLGAHVFRVASGLRKTSVRRRASSFLEGREEAYVLKTSFTPHGQVKDEKLEKARFAERLLAQLPGEPCGTREFSLPIDLMPSFEGVRARVVW